MRRSHRVVFSIAATAALAGGVGAAVGAVPASHPTPKASVLPVRSADDPANKAAQAEAVWQKAELARTSSDGERLRAQIAQLEVATVRAQGVRAQKIRAQKIRAQSIRAMELRQLAQALSQQRAVQAAGQQANAGQASYIPSRPAPRLAAAHAPRRSAASVRATRSSAPPTHARTGASGAPTSTGKDKDDSEHDSGGSDD